MAEGTRTYRVQVDHLDYRRLQRTVPSYLADEFQQPVDVKARRRLLCASSFVIISCLPIYSPFSHWRSCFFPVIASRSMSRRRHLLLFSGNACEYSCIAKTRISVLHNWKTANSCVFCVAPGEIFLLVNKLIRINTKLVTANAD